MKSKLQFSTLADRTNLSQIVKTKPLLKFATALLLFANLSRQLFRRFFGPREAGPAAARREVFPQTHRRQIVQTCFSACGVKGLHRITNTLRLQPLRWLRLRGALAFVLLTGVASGADLVWTNLAGGNWNLAANWSPNQVPAAADNAFITNSGTYVVASSANNTINSLTLGGESGTQTLSISGGTLTLTNTSTVGVNGILSLALGTLAGAGNLAVNGNFIWTGGALSGTGVRTIASGGVLTISGSATKSLSGGATLINMAQATWSQGLISVGLGAAISNAPGGTFDITSDVSYLDGGGAITTRNAGLWRKTGGSGLTTLNDAFENSGTVEVQSGTLQLIGGGTSTGSFAILAGAVLDFGGGTHNLNSGANVSGAGTLVVSANTVNLVGTFSGPGPVVLSGGTLNANSGDGFAVTNLIIGGGILAGTGPVSITGLLTWTNGGFGGSGSVHANGGTTISGAATKNLSGRTLVNTAQATWSAGQLSVGGTGTILSNAPGATFDITTDVSFFDNSGFITTFNAGLFRKMGGSGTTTLNDSFNNSGTLEIQSGTLRFVNPGSGTHTGNFVISPGATLEYAGATHDLNSGASIMGSALVITTGTLNVNNGASVAVSNLVFSAGTIGGVGPVSVSGLMTWTGGGLSGAGTLHANGGLVITGATTKSVSTRTLVNTANATWSEGPISVGLGAVISNAPSGTFDITFDGLQIDGGGANTNFNAGLWRKLAGAGAATFPENFINSGTVEVQNGALTFPGLYTQTAGQILLHGGNITNSAALRILGGILAGTNIIAGSVTNSATVSPGASPGQLTITGNYTETTNATLGIEVAGPQPGTQHDRLVVGGTARLAGTLALTTAGGFFPTTNDLFTILTAGSRVGVFASVLANPSFYGVETSYTATQAVVRFIPPALAIAPGTANVFIGESQTFTAVGGAAPFTFGMTVNNSGGSINPSSGQYTAGNLSGVVDMVRVTDSLGTTADASVSVALPPPPIVLVSGEVRDKSNAAISNAVLDVTGPGGESFTRLFSSPTGAYSVELPKFGTYTIVATHTQYTFAPPAVTLSNVLLDQVVNFTGTIIDPRVSGLIRDSAGAGLGNVTLALQEAGQRARRAFTLSSGNYQFSGLIAGRTYTLTPSPANSRFEPPSVQFTASITNEIVNFTGFPAATVSGRLTNSAGTGFGNAVVFFDDAASGTNVTSTSTLTTGDFISSLLSTGRTYRVRPVLPGVVFSPANRTVGPLAASVTGADFTGSNSLFSVSGLITNSGGFRLNSGTVQVTGGTNRTAVVSASGNYSVPGLLSQQSYTITPSRSNFTFAPTQLVIPLLTENVTANFISAPPYPLPGRIAFRNGMALHVMNADATDPVMLTTIFPLSASSTPWMGPT